MGGPGPKRGLTSKEGVMTSILLCPPTSGNPAFCIVFHQYLHTDTRLRSILIPIPIPISDSYKLGKQDQLLGTFSQLKKSSENLVPFSKFSKIPNSTQVIVIWDHRCLFRLLVITWFWILIPLKCPYQYYVFYIKYTNTDNMLWLIQIQLEHHTTLIEMFAFLFNSWNFCNS